MVEGPFSQPPESAETLAVSPRAETLGANELQLLADRSSELAESYERDAEFMDDEEGRQIALALAKWRRDRSRYFRELSAHVERAESRSAYATPSELGHPAAPKSDASTQRSKNRYL